MSSSGEYHSHKRAVVPKPDAWTRFAACRIGRKEEKPFTREIRPQSGAPG